MLFPYTFFPKLFKNQFSSKDNKLIKIKQPQLAEKEEKKKKVLKILKSEGKWAQL